MIWIHVGGFMFGSGNGETDAYGPGYILDRDAVLVTINYRLAVLGQYLVNELYTIYLLKLVLRP